MTFEKEQSSGDPHVVEPPEPKAFVDNWDKISAAFKALETQLREAKALVIRQDQLGFEAFQIYRMWAMNEFAAAVMWRKRAEAAEAQLAAAASTASVTKE